MTKYMLLMLFLVWNWGCGESNEAPLHQDPASFEDKNAKTCKRWKSIRLPWDERYKTEPLPENCRPSTYRQDNAHAGPVTHFYCRVCMDPK